MDRPARETREDYRRLDAFLKAQAFEYMPGMGRMAEKLMERSGLMDEDPEALLDMRIVFTDYQQSKVKT